MRTAAIVVLSAAAFLFVIPDTEADAQFSGGVASISRVEYLWVPGQRILDIKVTAQSCKRETRPGDPSRMVWLGASVIGSDRVFGSQQTVDSPLDRLGAVAPGSTQEHVFHFESLPYEAPWQFSVSAWDRVVERHECEAHNGTACEYCLRNGFHFDGQLATTGWIAAPASPLHGPGQWFRVR